MIAELFPGYRRCPIRRPQHRAEAALQQAWLSLDQLVDAWTRMWRTILTTEAASPDRARQAQHAMAEGRLAYIEDMALRQLAGDREARLRGLSPRGRALRLLYEANFGKLREAFQSIADRAAT